MFEVGKRYEFRMIEGGDEVLFWGKIDKYEHPLIKLADDEPGGLKITGEDGALISELKMEAPIRGRIINVISPNFVSAELED